ncbi:MAG: glutamate racemase, partial [Syntrophales bacterium]|nr:glutamate racemase [Syntrophales bacterium]
SQITEFLLQQGVKLLILACNTMAAVAHQAVTGLSPVPVLDVIDAGARSAVAGKRTKKVGIIGTPATIASNAYEQAIHRHNPDIRIVSQACPLFVPLVEEGWLDHQVTRLTAREYLEPMLTDNIDTLVLGCTHYPLIKELLQEVVGNDIRLVDSAEAMAEMAETLLREKNLSNPDRMPPDYKFYVTDVPYRFQAIGERFLGRQLFPVQLIKW